MFTSLRSLPSAIDDALDTLYEPNAVFSQFLGSASVTFPFFLSLLPLLVFSCFFVFSLLSFFVFHFLVFSLLSFFVFHFLVFSLSSVLFIVSFFQLTCVCRAYA